MSRRRNRHRSASVILNQSNPQKSSKQKKSYLNGSTAQSHFFSTRRSCDGVNFDRIQIEKIYNKNISSFRQNFNQNDTSQLPFMSSLREPQHFQSKEPKSMTICFPFDASLKTTMNQSIKKRISDFSAKTNRMTVAYYRWHGKSGLNNKTATQFETTLRDYNLNRNSQEQNYYSFVKPITYKDVEDKVYEKNQLICDRQKRLFKIK